MINYSLILTLYYPTAEWFMSDNDYATLEWKSAAPKPSQAELDALWPAAQIKATVPAQVPMWAVRTVLQNDGLFDQAQALINETNDVALKNVWEYGNFADRNSRAINVLAIELDLTDAQVDQMFIDANNLSV